MAYNLVGQCIAYNVVGQCSSLQCSVVATIKATDREANASVKI